MFRYTDFKQKDKILNNYSCEFQNDIRNIINEETNDEKKPIVVEFNKWT